MTDCESCSTHPDAPHGFDRNSSHSLGRYVCDCESWSPELVKRLRDTAERNGAVMNTSLYSEAADMIEQQAGEIERLKQVAAEMAEALEKVLYWGNPYGFGIKDVLEKWKELNNGGS